eukprot:8001654-Alexandrium_andersonii.AAC.1
MACTLVPRLPRAHAHAHLGKVPQHPGLAVSPGKFNPQDEIIVGPHTHAPAGRHVASAALSTADVCDVDFGC